jgi:hypothetical protein
VHSIRSVHRILFDSHEIYPVSCHFFPETPSAYVLLLSEAKIQIRTKLQAKLYFSTLLSLSFRTADEKIGCCNRMVESIVRI